MSEKKQHDAINYGTQILENNIKKDVATRKSTIKSMT